MLYCTQKYHVLVYNIHLRCKIVLKFCTEHDNHIPQNFENISYLGNMFWPREISKALSVRWFEGSYSKPQQHPVVNYIVVVRVAVQLTKVADYRGPYH